MTTSIYQIEFHGYVFLRVYCLTRHRLFSTIANTTTQYNGTCKDRDLRVVDGENVRQGRVEICYNQAWGTICDRVYGDVAAGILCQELGFRRKRNYNIYSNLDISILHMGELQISVATCAKLISILIWRNCIIRASVDALCRDDTSEISRDPRLQTRRACLARPSEHANNNF